MSFTGLIRFHSTLPTGYRLCKVFSPLLISSNLPAGWIQDHPFILRHFCAFIYLGFSHTGHFPLPTGGESLVHKRQVVMY